MQIIKDFYLAGTNSKEITACFSQLHTAGYWRQFGFCIRHVPLETGFLQGGVSMPQKNIDNYGISSQCAREDLFIKNQKIIGCTVGVSNVANSLGDEIISVDIMHSLHRLGYTGDFAVIYNCPCCDHIDFVGDPKDKKTTIGIKEGHYFRSMLFRFIPSFVIQLLNSWQRQRELDLGVQQLDIAIERLNLIRDYYQFHKESQLLNVDLSVCSGKPCSENDLEYPAPISDDPDVLDDAARQYSRPEHWSQQKLGKLFSRVDFDKEEGQIHWGSGASHIRFFHLRTLLEDPVVQNNFRKLDIDLLFSGIYGGGFSSILKKTLVKCHFMLSPYKWSVEGRQLSMCGKSDDCTASIETYPLKYVHRESMVAQGAPSLFEIADQFFLGDIAAAGVAELARFPSMLQKRAIIPLLEQSWKKKVALCGIYGLNQHLIKADKCNIASRLVVSIAESGLLSQRNGAIVFLNEFPENEWNQVVSQLSPPASVSVRATTINKLTSEEVMGLATTHNVSQSCLLLINTGPVTDAIFKGIMQSADFFVTEGANSVSQSIKFNKCYLSPISQDSYYVRNNRYLTELPDSTPHTGSVGTTLLMNLASQAVRGEVALKNIGHYLSWDEKLDNFLFFSLLAGVDLSMLLESDAYGRIKRLSSYVESLSLDSRTLKFLYYNVKSGYLSIGQAVRLMQGKVLGQTESQEILTQIIKHEYMPEGSSIKQLFTKLNDASRKRDNDIVVGALASLFDVIGDTNVFAGIDVD